VQLVAAQRADRLGPVEPAPAVVTAVQHLDQRPAVELGLLVRLREPPRHDARTEPPRAGVRDVLPGEQAQEVGLAAAVGAEDGQALAVEDLEVEGRMRPLSSSPSQVSARRPVRPPLRRITTFWSTTCSGGGPAARNFS
jgi:hypothetical protein